MIMELQTRLKAESIPYSAPAKNRQLQRSTIEGPASLTIPPVAHDLCNLKIHAAPKEPEPTEPIELKSESGPGAHPYTAGALIASGSVGSCKVPAGNYGSAKVVKYRIFDFNGKPVTENLKVEEKFSKIEDK